MICASNCQRLSKNSADKAQIRRAVTALRQPCGSRREGLCRGSRREGLCVGSAVCSGALLRGRIFIGIGVPDLGVPDTRQPSAMRSLLTESNAKAPSRTEPPPLSRTLSRPLSRYRPPPPRFAGTLASGLKNQASAMRFASNARARMLSWRTLSTRPWTSPRRSISSSCI